jgi:hypothetical protein
MAILDIGVGLAPNDGTGDSIRDSFVKTNSNFQFLDAARQNLTTGNLTATGNLALNATTPSYWTGTILLNGIEIATKGTTFSGGTVANPTVFQATTPATSNITGAVTIGGGLGVAGDTYLTGLRARSATVDLGFSAATITIGGIATFQSDTYTGKLITTGDHSATGNITAANVGAYQFTGTKVQGTVLTNAQPFITSLGTLQSLAVAGNITAANITLTGWGNIVAANATLSGKLITNSVAVLANATVTGNITAGNVIGGIGTFSNLTVTSVPTIQSVTTKQYVTATVVGFAIGLGS